MHEHIQIKEKCFTLAALFLRAIGSHWINRLLTIACRNSISERDQPNKQINEKKKWKWPIECGRSKPLDYASIQIRNKTILDSLLVRHQFKNVECLSFAPSSLFSSSETFCLLQLSLFFFLLLLTNNFGYFACSLSKEGKITVTINFCMVIT